MANGKLKSYDLEPIDVYGNWRVKRLFFPSKLKVGLTEGRSTFKIRNNGVEHVLVKKGNVRWNGKATQIRLKTVARGTSHYNFGFRLKAEVKCEGQRLAVAFGSLDSGKSLIFHIEEIETRKKVGRPHAGSFGTAGRGG